MRLMRSVESVAGSINILLYVDYVFVVISEERNTFYREWVSRKLTIVSASTFV